MSTKYITKAIGRIRKELNRLEKQVAHIDAAANRKAKKSAKQESGSGVRKPKVPQLTAQDYIDALPPTKSE
jgi:hypothetical protein